jgi:hypothetical protein
LTNLNTGKWIINGGTVVIPNSELNLGAVPASVVPDYITLNGGTMAPQIGSMSANRGITVGPIGGGYAGGGTMTYAGTIGGIFKVNDGGCTWVGSIHFASGFSQDVFVGTHGTKYGAVESRATAFRDKRVN